MRRALLLLLIPALASANGRPPVTNGVFFKPADPSTIYVRSTFGLLVSRDAGCSFRWVCEKAIGYGGEFDPKYAAAADGTIFATTFTGLHVSRDGGCTWSVATAEQPAGPGKIDDIWIDALDIAPNNDLWVATAESAKPNDVFRSTDNGVTFAPRGRMSPTVWYKSVKVARKDPQRVYLTGYQVAGMLPDGGQAQPQAHLYRTDNGGDDWTEPPLTGMRFGPTPIVFVSAVDPEQVGTLLLTSQAANGEGDVLYRSTDSGDTFVEALQTSASIRDVLFRPDGTVYVATVEGTFRSTDRGASFQPLPGTPKLACLGQSNDGELFGCGTNWDPDFKAIAKSADGASWEKQFRFIELAGPLECAAGTTSADVCDPMWPALQQQFGATGPTTCVAPPDATPPPPKKSGCCDAGEGQLGALALIGWLALLTRRRASSDTAAPRRARA